MLAPSAANKGDLPPLLSAPSGYASEDNGDNNSMWSLSLLQAESRFRIRARKARSFAQQLKK